MKGTVREIAEAAKCASRRIATASGSERNKALVSIALALEDNWERLLEVNCAEASAASEQVKNGEMSPATLDRLKLTREKISEMACSVRSVAELPDPIGRLQQRTELDSGLVLEKVSCPLGVLAVLFEARPDAVTQIGALALKSGNAAILKAGSEVERTAQLLVAIMQEAVVDCGIPAEAIVFVTGRAAVHELLEMDDLIDLVIPRGSKQLVEFVQRRARIPVLGHAEGICHVYVDALANQEMALKIVDDAKTDYPAACNAAETVLVHQSIAKSFLPRMADLALARGVQLRGCDASCQLLSERMIEPVAEDDWRREYGDLTLAVRIVSSLDEAIAHIRRYGSSHTETIVTEDRAIAERFLQEVDSAGVFHNASTRFADGYRYGFGAEVGVSTSKLHARGPVGLSGLTSYKYLLRGQGHVAGEYRGINGRRFHHKELPLE